MSKVRELQFRNINALSLVDKGANNKTFTIFKNSDGGQASQEGDRNMSAQNAQTAQQPIDEKQIEGIVQKTVKGLFGGLFGGNEQKPTVESLATEVATIKSVDIGEEIKKAMEPLAGRLDTIEKALKPEVKDETPEGDSEIEELRKSMETMLGKIKEIEATKGASRGQEGAETTEQESASGPLARTVGR